MMTLLALLLSAGAVAAQPAPAETVQPDPVRAEPAAPEPVRRPNAVDLHETYAMEGLTVPENEIHTLLPRDAIPALTDPALQPIAEADWMTPDDRVIEVVINGEAVAAPLRILNWHEVANMTVGGEPVAATYCPLCDSATLISRRHTLEDGSARVLEFGVSGALYNSNVLMYDRTDMALWSQLGMRAVSGPHAGTSLEHLPARIIPWGRFLLEHPEGAVISVETGHERDYANPEPYEWFFADPDRLLVPVQGMGDALPRKTLGVGVRTEGGAWFVPADAIGTGYTLTTDLGDVVLETTDAGIAVVRAPQGAHTAQAFYYSWSAFHPNAVIVGSDEE